MAGVGPPPKDPSKRARKNKDVVALRVVEVQPTAQPELPSFTIMVTVDDQVVTQEFEWPAMTRDWWAMLAHHPLAAEFIDTDWAYLLETARLHAEFWNGKLSLAPELRLREAKYGFTPDDRARLRLQFAQATGAEVDTKRKVAASSRERFGGLSLPPEANAN